MAGSDLAGSSPVEHQPTGWAVEIVYFFHLRIEVERRQGVTPATTDGPGLTKRGPTTPGCLRTLQAPNETLYASKLSPSRIRHIANSQIV